MAQEMSSARCFGGLQKVFKHDSAVLGCSMTFGLYLPPQAFANSIQKLPVIYYLSGLTCTEANFIQKSGFQRYAAEHGIIVVNPDTSPRGCNIPGEDDSWDFGTGAGFYVDATNDPWAKNYKMYSYVLKELPKLVGELCPVDGNKLYTWVWDSHRSTSIVGFGHTSQKVAEMERLTHIKAGIMGHSMGGHGALTLTLKNPAAFKSVSAFAPICNPTGCPWGKKAFSGYFGDGNNDLWRAHDSTELIKSYDGPKLNILIDQGGGDNFLAAGQLLPENFVASAKGNANVSVDYRLQEEYDHSYFFVSTFIGDHFAHHAKFLKA